MKITLALLGIIFFSFLLQAVIPGYTELFYLDSAHVQIWQFVTSIFLHGGLTHIIFNSYALFLFGTILEARLGQKNYLILFFIAGIAGNILYYATTLVGIIPPLPALGASGAIFGIFGALVVTDPNLRLLLFFIIPLKIRDAAILWFILEFFGAFNAGSGVASAAHLGGMVVGYLIAKMYYKPRMSHEMYDWRMYQKNYHGPP
ncbi:MAG: rhomboid family intramembrane serine protease [Candidatus Micrarchaeota archaeon]